MATRKPLPRKVARAAPSDKKPFLMTKADLNQMTCSFSHLAEIGKDVGIELWKQIDEDTLEKIVRSKQGVLQEDKCYILLFTYSCEGTELAYRCHAWYGKLVKDDTKMTGACDSKCRELELHFEGRSFELLTEVQGQESAQFMSYFRSGLQYEPPVKLRSGAAAAAPASDARLYHLKGRRNVRVTQVPVATSSLNSGDVFVLDTDATLWQWNGSGASRMEKGKGLDLTTRLRDERGAKASVVIIEEKENDPESKHAEFWRLLGGKGPIAPAAATDDDESFEKAAVRSYKLYRVCDQSGELEVTEVEPEGDEYDVKQLDPNDCFLLDCGTSLFVWVGKKSTEREKAGAMQNAKDFLRDSNRPSWTPISKCSQGAESALFKDKIRKGTWGEYVETGFDRKTKQTNKTAVVKQDEKVNVDSLHHPEKYAIAREELRQVVPSNGVEAASLQMWYIENKKIHPLPDAERGQFFSQNAYIVLYAYHVPDGSLRYVCYFWLGRHVSKEDGGACALLAREVAAPHGSSCISIRVTQNKEPAHFLSHFRGLFVVRRGHRAAPKAPDQMDTLFHIRGVNAVNCGAVEVDKATRSLNTNDAFVLVSPQLKAVWIGKGTNEVEREFAQHIATELAPGAVFSSLAEGAESDEFWAALGGKGEYANAAELQQGNVSARLFQMSNREGVFRAWEVPNFSQEDLDSDDVMMLDAGFAVFAWIGSGANEVEKKEAMEVAAEYVRTQPSGRTGVPIVRVDQGAEPPAFTGEFFGWDATKAKEMEDPYAAKLLLLQKKCGESFHGPAEWAQKQAAMKAKLAEKQTPTPATAAPSSSSSSSSSSPSSSSSSASSSSSSSSSTGGGRYSFQRLKEKPWPADVVPERLEDFLADDDFARLIKMSRDEFAKLPAWKKLNLKKSIGLF